MTETDEQTIAESEPDNSTTEQVLPAAIEESESLMQSTDSASSVRNEPKISPLLAGFINNLTAYFAPLEIKKQWRELNNGLFVDHELVPKLVKSLAEFRARETKTEIVVDDRIWQLLFGQQHPIQYYLLEGKLCMVGCFIPIDNVTKLKAGPPSFRGSLIDCRDQLHPRDPLLSNLSGVQTTLDRTGFTVKLKINESLLTVSGPALSAFHNVLLSSARIRSKNKAASRSLRDCLIPLGRLLGGAALVRPKQTLFIPGSLRQERQAEYYRRGGLIFVVINNELSMVYELRGRNLLQLIDRELSDLRSQRTYRVGELSLSRKPGAIIGSIRTPDGEQNLVHTQMLLRMLELALRRRTLRRQLKPRFTLFDLLRLFSNLFCDTVRIEPREVPYVLLKSYLNLQMRKAERRQKDNLAKNSNNSRNSRRSRAQQGQASNGTDPESLHYRSGGGWIFFIHDRRVVRSMLERKVPASPTVTILGRPEATKIDS